MYFWLHIALLTVLFSALGFGGGSMYKDILCLLFVSTIVDEKWKYLILLYCVHQGSREDYYQMQNKEKTLHFPHFPIFVIFLIILSSNYQWATVKAQYVTAVFYSFFLIYVTGIIKTTGKGLSLVASSTENDLWTLFWVCPSLLHKYICSPAPFILIVSLFALSHF